MFDFIMHTCLIITLFSPFIIIALIRWGYSANAGIREWTLAPLGVVLIQFLAGFLVIFQNLVYHTGGDGGIAGYNLMGTSLPMGLCLYLMINKAYNKDYGYKVGSGWVNAIRIYFTSLVVGLVLQIPLILLFGFFMNYMGW